MKVALTFCKLTIAIPAPPFFILSFFCFFFVSCGSSAHCLPPSHSFFSSSLYSVLLHNTYAFFTFLFSTPLVFRAFIVFPSLSLETFNTMSAASFDLPLTERPKDTLLMVQANVKAAHKLNDELATYVRERAMLEDSYAKGLQKLSKKIWVSDRASLGSMADVWDSLQHELIESATIHADLASRCLHDVDRSLRTALPDHPAYKKLHSMEAFIQKLVKEYDERRVKLNKVLGTKKKAQDPKHAEAKKALEITQIDWQQQKENYLRTFQQADEHRWNAMKNTLQLFVSLHKEHLLQRIQVIDEKMNQVSDVDAGRLAFAYEDAIHHHHHPHDGSDIQPEPSISQPTTISTTTSPRSPRTLPSTPSQPTLLIDTLDDDAVLPVTRVQSSEMSESASSPTHSHPTPPTTVSPSPSTPSIKAPKKFLSNFTMRRKSRSVVSLVDPLSLMPSPPTGDEGNQSGISSFPMGRRRRSSTPHQQQVEKQQEKHEKHETGTKDWSKELHAVHEEHPPMELLPPKLRKASSFADSFISSGTASATSPLPPSPLVDEQGFSIPPADRFAPLGTPVQDNGDDDDDDDDNEHDNEHASSKSNGHEMMMEGSSGETNGFTPKIRLDIKSDGIRDDAGTSQVALTRVQSMLKESSRPAGNGRRRGRRDVRSTAPSTPSPLALLPPVADSAEKDEPLVSSMNASSLSMVASPVAPTESSISTAPSPTSPNHNPNPNPFAAHLDAIAQSPPSTPVVVDAQWQPTPMHQNESISPITVPLTINETLHAELHDGKATRVMVQGIVSLGADDAPKDGVFYLGLRHDGALKAESAHSAVQWLATDDDDAADTLATVFQVDAAKLTPGDADSTRLIQYTTTRTATPSLPLTITPLWKCDADQTRLLIKYTHEGCQQLMMMTQINKECAAAQSLPTGQWIVDQQRMLWDLENETSNMVRARFSTATQADPQPIAARFTLNHLISGLAFLETHPVYAVATPTLHTATRTGKYLAF
ncbi:hypothetical protein BC940DRAFT_66743 [Gongronella butleri]|nr:hypothetical protein BC940DRAFT_66743 [Gongronella butleri]